MTKKTPAPKADDAPAPIPSQPTGPTSGGDPSVSLAVQGPSATDAPINDAAAMELSQDNNTGPRQEPVHQGAVQTEETGDSKPVPKHKALGKDGRSFLVERTIYAMEKMDYVSVTDEYGRIWAMHYEPVSNQATVKITVQRDDAIESLNLSTSTLNEKSAGEAIDTLDKAVK